MPSSKHCQFQRLTCCMRSSIHLARWPHTRLTQAASLRANSRVFHKDSHQHSACLLDCGEVQPQPKLRQNAKITTSRQSTSGLVACNSSAAKYRERCSQIVRKPTKPQGTQRTIEAVETHVMVRKPFYIKPGSPVAKIPYHPYIPTIYVLVS